MRIIKLEKLGIEILYTPLKEGALGFWDEKAGQICIDSKQTKIQQDIILIHELLHLVSSCLKQMGITKKHIDHKFIENCSTQLLTALVLAGKWKGLSKKEVIDYSFPEF